MLEVTAFYLGQLKITQCPKLAMGAAVTEFGFRRSTVYKWLKWRRRHFSENASARVVKHAEDADG